jgi:hypothetical protein
MVLIYEFVRVKIMLLFYKLEFILMNGSDFGELLTKSGADGLLRKTVLFDCPTQ